MSEAAKKAAIHTCYISPEDEDREDVRNTGKKVGKPQQLLQYNVLEATSCQEGAGRVGNYGLKWLCFFFSAFFFLFAEGGICPPDTWDAGAAPTL